MGRTRLVIGILAVTLAAGCGRTAPVAPIPQESDAAIASRRRVQDSIESANRAVATAAAAERDRQLALANEARADSIERVRKSAEVAARKLADDAASTNTALRTELGMMVHFDPAKALIQADGGAALDRKVVILKANPMVRLRITGACDELGSDRYNMALGNRRSAAVRRYLVDKGIDAARLDATSHGEGTPIDAGKDAPARARNRRAEFVVVSDDAQLSMK